MKIDCGEIIKAILAMMILRRDSTINLQSLLIASLKDDSINILFLRDLDFYH